MKFVPHPEESQEVFTFARTAILCRTNAKASSLFSTIHGFDQAVFKAEGETYGGYLWEDIRQIEMGEVMGAYYECEDWREHEVNVDDVALRNILKINLPGSFRRIFEHVFGDMHYCARKRLILGRAPGFFESVFDAYKVGFWPCGWDGDYPSGRLLVLAGTTAG